MVEFLQHHFRELVQIVGSYYWIIGILLMFVKAPRSEEYRAYRLAQRLLAVYFLAMSTNLYAWGLLFKGNWNSLDPVLGCIDVTFFYLSSIFMAYCISTILNKDYITRHKVVKDFVSWAVAAGIAWASFIPVLKPYSVYLFALSLFLYIEVVVRFFYRFHCMYANLRRMLDNYFSEDMNRFTIWLKRSLLLLILSGVLAVLTWFYGVYFNWFFQIYVVTVNIYLAIEFFNYRELYGKLNASSVVKAEDINDMQEKMSADNFEMLYGEKVDRWVDDKKYLLQQLTIDDFAAELGTNKAYLSRYINGKYAVTFTTWITRLRLEEAKLYMKSHPDVKQEDVAQHSGFSSSSYFSRVFSRAEGKTPAVWRKQQVEN